MATDAANAMINHARMQHLYTYIRIVFIVVNGPVVRVWDHCCWSHHLRHVLRIVKQIQMLQVMLAKTWLACVPRENIVFVPAISTAEMRLV